MQHIGNIQDGNPIFMKTSRKAKRCFTCREVIPAGTTYKFIGERLFFRHKSYESEAVMFHLKCPINIKGLVDDFYNKGWSYLRRSNEYLQQSRKPLWALQIGTIEWKGKASDQLLTGLDRHLKVGFAGGKRKRKTRRGMRETIRFWRREYTIKVPNHPLIGRRVYWRAGDESVVRKVWGKPAGIVLEARNHPSYPRPDYATLLLRQGAHEFHFAVASNLVVKGKTPLKLGNGWVRLLRQEGGNVYRWYENPFRGIIASVVEGYFPREANLRIGMPGDRFEVRGDKDLILNHGDLDLIRMIEMHVERRPTTTYVAGKSKGSKPKLSQYQATLIKQLAALNPRFTIEHGIVAVMPMTDGKTIRLHHRKGRIVNIDITYNAASDLYDIKAYQLLQHGIEMRTIFSGTGIYVDQLDDVIRGIISGHRQGKWMSKAKKVILRLHKRRKSHAQIIDEAMVARFDVKPPYPGWKHDPARRDVEGVDLFPTTQKQIAKLRMYRAQAEKTGTGRSEAFKHWRSPKLLAEYGAVKANRDKLVKALSSGVAYGRTLSKKDRSLYRLEKARLTRQMADMLLVIRSRRKQGWKKS